MKWATDASIFEDVCLNDALPPARAGLGVLGMVNPAFAFGFTLGFMLTACFAGSRYAPIGVLNFYSAKV